MYKSKSITSGDRFILYNKTASWVHFVDTNTGFVFYGFSGTDILLKKMA